MNGGNPWDWTCLTGLRACGPHFRFLLPWLCSHGLDFCCPGYVTLCLSSNVLFGSEVKFQPLTVKLKTSAPATHTHMQEQMQTHCHLMCPLPESHILLCISDPDFLRDDWECVPGIKADGALGRIARTMETRGSGAVRFGFHFAYFPTPWSVLGT